MTDAVSTQEAIEEILEGWEPPGRWSFERKRRRESARQTLEWLRDRGEPVLRQHAIREVYPETDVNLKSNTWWGNVVLPVFKRATVRGYIEIEVAQGHWYHWVGAENTADDT